MLGSRFCTPYQNQTNAEIQYAAQDRSDTPAAWRFTHIATTCGIVMRSVKIERAPRSFLVAFSGITGCGRIIWTSVNEMLAGIVYMSKEISHATDRETHTPGTHEIHDRGQGGVAMQMRPIEEPALLRRLA